jgi:hypothetical protein
MPTKNNIDVEAPTDPSDSIVTGRNGVFHINKLWVWENGIGQIYIEGIGRRGKALRGGLRVTKHCFVQLCRQFLHEVDKRVAARAAELLPAGPPDTADCVVDDSGSCSTHGKVHLRETAAAMGIPAGDSKNYLVTWEIDMEAATPREAAQKALDIMRDPESIGTVFKVCDAQQEYVIDLLEGEGADDGQEK